MRKMAWKGDLPDPPSFATCPIAFEDHLSGGWYEDGQGLLWYSSEPNGRVTARVDPKTRRVVVHGGNNDTWRELEGKILCLGE